MRQQSAYVGGVRAWWFLVAFLAAAAVFPLLWKYFFQDYQKLRILAPFDPSIDPEVQEEQLGE